MVIAGESQDKANNGALVQWSGVGINLGTRRPSVKRIGEAVKSILEDSAYKEKATSLSKNFARYDVAEVFHEVIQEAVLAWKEKVETSKDEL